MENEIDLLYTIIRNNLHDLESIEIIPYEISDETNTNNSDYIPFHLIDNNLGIPRNLVKKLFSKVLGKFLEKWDDSEAVAYSTCMLVINPNWYPIWNIRNELISNKLVNINDELVLNYLLLNSNYGNKINQLWYYRLTLIAQLTNIGNDNSINIKQKEFGNFYNFTNQNPRNYYYWNYILQLNFNLTEFSKVFDKFQKLILNNPFELGGFNCLLHYSLTYFNENNSFLLSLIDNYCSLLGCYLNNECIWSSYYLLLNSVKDKQLLDIQKLLLRQFNSFKFDNLNSVGSYWKLKCESVFVTEEAGDGEYYNKIKKLLKIKQSGSVNHCN